MSDGPQTIKVNVNDLVEKDIFRQAVNMENRTKGPAYVFVRIVDGEKVIENNCQRYTGKIEVDENGLKKIVDLKFKTGFRNEEPYVEAFNPAQA